MTDLPSKRRGCSRFHKANAWVGLCVCLCVQRLLSAFFLALPSNVERYHEMAVEHPDFRGMPRRDGPSHVLGPSPSILGLGLVSPAFCPHHRSLCVYAFAKAIEDASLV